MAYGNRRAAPMPYNNNFGATYMDGPQSSEPTKEHTEWARKRSKAQKKRSKAMKKSKGKH